MRRVLIFALAGAAIAAATPASAATVVTSPGATTTLCTAFTFSASYSECAGGFTGNLIKGTLQAPGLKAIEALGYPTSGTGAYLATSSVGSASTDVTFNFGVTLSGPTIVGIHYGAADGGGTQATSFFLFDFTTPTSSLTVDSRGTTNPNFGLSNAAVFSTGAVPEASTWAMMLFGFAGMGLTVRRGRRPTTALMQVA